MIRKFFNRFRQLQWKLTLSYTLVSVAAIIIFEILAIFAVTKILIKVADEAGPSYLQNMSTIVSPLVKDNASWQSFDDILHPSKMSKASDNVTISDFFGFTMDIQGASDTKDIQATSDTKQDSKEPPPDSLFLIVNKNLKPLYNLNGNNNLDKSLESLSELEKNVLLESLETGKLIKKEYFNSILMAQPIIEDGQIIGAILAGFVISFKGILTDVVPNLLKLLLALTVVIAIVGSIFGYISSRSLVKRFNKIQAGPEAWQKGEFDFRINSNAKDELGKLSRNLNNMAEEIQGLLKNRQELATLEERQRLARELHDSVKQQVFASGMQIATVKLKTDPDSPTIKHLDAAETLIHQAQEELSSLIHKLMPVALEGKGLVQAIREHLESWQDNEEILVEFQTTNNLKISSELEYALFRIIQESFANIAKHSKATKVLIRLEQKQNKLELIIKDNGIGFNSSKPSKGIGLISMQERLEPFGGKLIIDSSVNTGTILTIKIPNKGEKNA